MAGSSSNFQRLRRLAVTAALAIVLYAVGSASSVLAGQSSSSSALLPSILTPEYVVERLAEKNQQLDTYQAHVKIEFRLHSFPYVREHLDGTAYFKRPSAYQVVFKHVPHYARGFSHLSADLADASSWRQRFYMSYVGEREVGGHHDFVLRLVQRVRGQIDHQDVAVNRRLWEVDSIEYHYYNGGTIAMQQHFATIGGFRLITAQDAQIKIPFVKAVAHADYTEYHTNVALTSEATSVSK